MPPPPIRCRGQPSRRPPLIASLHMLLCVLCMLCTLLSTSALPWDSERAGTVNVHAAIAEAAVQLHPDEAAVPLDARMDPVAEGSVRGPVPDELQALLDRDPDFLAASADPDVDMHGGEPAPPATQTPWPRPLRSLLHGQHKQTKKFFVCSRCYRVTCYMGRGFCTGHCKKQRKLHWCEVPIGGPPAPPPAPDIPPGVDQIFIDEINTISVYAEKPYVGCTDQENGGCNRPPGFYNAREGKFPVVAPDGLVKPECEFGKRIQLRWYDGFLDDETAQVGVCKCTYAGADDGAGGGQTFEAPCESDRGSERPEPDPLVKNPFMYEPQSIDVAGTVVLLTISSAAQQEADPNENFMGVVGDVVDCVADEDYEPPERPSGEPVLLCNLNGSGSAGGGSGTTVKGQGKGKGKGKKATGKKKGKGKRKRKGKGKKATGKKAKGKKAAAKRTATKKAAAKKAAAKK